MRLLAVVFLVGCNQLYGLEPTTLDSFDHDEDGVEDALDNCPEVANADQSDEDIDTRGDRCDNCPLVANTDQQALGDADAVGDACDPHPDVDGDCLFLVDTFGDVAAFAAHWSVLGEPGDTPDVEPMVGSVAIRPRLEYSIGIVAREDSGEVMTGNYAVQLAGRSAPIVTYDAVVGVTSSSSHARGGYLCGIFGNFRELVYSAYDGLPMATSVMSSEPVLERFLMRLLFEGGQLACRVEHGVSVGALRAPLTQPPLTGAPGATVRKIDVVLDAFAAYQARVGEACPEVRWR